MELPFTIRRACGLSIIEILVVIAGLAILAAILLPLFGGARNMGYQAQCAGNLKQFAAAFNCYAQDWNSYWPAPGGLYGNKTYWSQSGKGGLESYIKQRGQKSVWCCPLTPEWTGPFPPRSYSMNSYLRTPADKEYPLCLSILIGIDVNKIQQPSRTVLLYEGMPLTDGKRESLDYLYRCANWTKVRGFAKSVAFTISPGQPWHGRKNNYLYCDGHITARRPGRTVGAELSTGSEMYQWYVDKNYFMNTYNTKWRRTAPWE